MEWDSICGGRVDIAIHKYDCESEWLVYADEQLTGGEQNPYKIRKSTIEQAKDTARALLDGPHPELEQDITLEYVEITEVKCNS
jgi:hypothetical protein